MENAFLGNLRMRIVSILIISTTVSLNIIAQEYQVKSPNEVLNITIQVNESLSFSTSYNGSEVLNVNNISMDLAKGSVLGASPKVRSKSLASIKEVIEAPLSTKSSKILDEYNMLTLNFKGNYSLEFRAYNDGCSYRFITNMKKDILVNSEQMRLEVDQDFVSWFPEEESFNSHFERLYIYTEVKNIQEKKFCSLPMLTGEENGIKVLFTESDLDDYPNMFLEKSGSATFNAIFPGYVLEASPKEGSEDRDEEITAASYIAKTDGSRSFPWRLFIIGEDRDIVASTLVYQLACPSKIEEIDWIEPGQIAWDWYNANNIYGVDFESGLNTATYKYYIDFASENGIKYIILDEGWSKSTTEITSSSDILDLEELIDYGLQKDVRIILWVLWKPLKQGISGILSLYSQWGIAGVKVDFMQRADQEMVNYYKEVGIEAAKHELLVDFHAAYKPTGLHREYPNVITFEGMKGEEHNKWSQNITPEHNLTLPFTRMVAGPMDYTPGAMSNAHLKNHFISFERPMSLGTRAHEIAKYVIFESPLQMLCDTPSRYKREAVCTNFITQIPQVWDETIVLEAKVSDYLIMARRSGDNWYVGAMTDWTSRDFEIPLDFLDEGNYELQVLQDGPNAEHMAEDFQVINTNTSRDKTLQAKLVSGGGWTAILKKTK